MLKKPPFFILANPRSGSSLLRIICDSHSNITVPPECGFMEWWYEKYKGWNIEDSNEILKVDEFLADLNSSKKFETWNLELSLIRKEIEKSKPSNYPELISLVYISYGKLRKDNINLWGDKNNYFIHKLPQLIALFPKAKFIHLIRDGRDVASSYKAIKKLETDSSYVPNLSTNVKVIAEEWLKNNEQISSFISKLDNKQFLEVKYEDMILNLELECKRICAFLNLPFDSQMLSYYTINREFQLEPAETIDWKKKTLEKPDASGIGKYRELLSKVEIKDFNTIALTQLKRNNYKL